MIDTVQFTSPGTQAGSSIAPGAYGEPIAKMLAYAPRSKMKKRMERSLGKENFNDFRFIICKHIISYQI
jgi:hypothetical protein